MDAHPYIQGHNNVVIDETLFCPNHRNFILFQDYLAQAPHCSLHCCVKIHVFKPE